MSERGTPEESAGEALERMVRHALESTANSSSGEADSGDTKEEIVRQVLMSESYQGSFAHPHILRQMDDVIPNGAERAFSMTEREQAHRHECDKRLISSEIECDRREYQDRRVVIIVASSFLILGLIAAFIAIMNGHNAGAGLAGGTVLIALLGMFGIRRRLRGSKE